MIIPKQLQNPEFRFVLLGKWNEWKNNKTKEKHIVETKDYQKYKENKEWNPLGKAPFEKAWQTKNNYKFDSLKLNNHAILDKKNFGVIGGYGNLRILDIDNKELAQDFLKQTNTYTVQTGSGGMHFYFISKYDKNHVLVNELGELRANNYQVVSAPCKHPSGNDYKVIRDVEIAKVDSEYISDLITNYLRPLETTKINLKETLTNLSEGKDTSRSAKEYREVIKLIKSGCNKQRVFSEMSAFAKWSNAPEQYKELTYTKALNYVDELQNTTTPYLPTTTHYIKAWGYFDKEKKLLIEQIEQNCYIYNNNGNFGIVRAEKIEKVDEENPKKKPKFIGYGFNIDGEQFIIKNMYDAKLFYNSPSLQYCEDFINGKYKPRKYLEIRKDLKKILKEMYDFNNDADVETCILQIDQSWIKPLLTSSFFLGIDSSFGGGKTTLGEIVFFLMRHGFVGGDISSASLPRLTNELDLNIFVDEIDQNLSDENFLSILRKGQRKNNPYVRCEGKDFRPVAYDVFGCHGFSFRAELEDAFMNRALRIHSKKSSDHKLPILNTYKRQILKPLADELFLWSISNLVATCSRHSEVFPVFQTRDDIYNSLISRFSDEEKGYMKKFFGRDAEIVYLCLDNSRILGVDIINNLKEIMNNRKADESSSENFYYDSLRDYIVSNQFRLLRNTLQDGIYSGSSFYPKNRLYQDFIQYLKTMNINAIGTKKFTSLLRDFGFVEGDTLMSERYGDNKYGTPCLIFSDRMLINLGIKEKIEKLKVEVEKIE